MIFSRILLFNRLICSRTNPNSPNPIFLRGFFIPNPFFNPSPFFHTEKISSPSPGNPKPTKSKNLSSIFTNPSEDSQSKNKPSIKEEKNLPQISRFSKFGPIKEKKFPEELSPEANLLLKCLQEELHLKVEAGQTMAKFPSRHLLRLAAEKFGQRHQEIAKWLSGSHLKKVALLGCPSTERKTVFASKRLRSFFCIQEDIICRGCKIKNYCKFVNQRVDKVERVILADVMRLLTILAFDAVPEQLSVSSDVKLSVDKLLKEAINLSS